MHEVLDWFGPSYRVIVMRTVLMYYIIEIDSSLFLSRSFRVFPRDVSDSFSDDLDVDLSSLFIVGEPAHRV
jgi:hypothetical protein